MTQIHDIRKEYFEKGKSISKITRELGHDRKTIRAYFQKDDWNQKHPNPKKENDFPKLEPFKATIDEWLEEDKKSAVNNDILQKGSCQIKRNIPKISIALTDSSRLCSCKKKEYWQRQRRLPAFGTYPWEAQVKWRDDFLLEGKLYVASSKLSFPNSNQGFTSL